MTEHQSAIQQTDLAIIGMSCRLPGAEDPEEFWERILVGDELLVSLDDDELRAGGVPEELLRSPNFVRVSGLIDHHGELDADFFRIAPSEARLMDPQHRLALELGWLALEDAGYDPDTYPHDIGVFCGGGRHAYLRHVEPHFEEWDYLDGSIHGLQSDVGNYGDFLATRVSYKLGLTGPSLNVQTACSTGLVSVHLACQSLLLGEADIALAGAVNLHTPQRHGYWFEEGSICSPDGHLRPFDEQANGSVFGNGGGMVALKRLEDALSDGDRVVAVVKATALNNDGSDKMSFTAPSVGGQAGVIARAHALAGIDPESIGYVETHGTGTVLGDPIEIAALRQAFPQPNGSAPFCALGSVKSQIGHLGPAAGIAGLIKAALVVERGLIPPCVNFQTANPKLELEGSPFYVPRERREWSGHRVASVSAFGVGGTNAHAVLTQAPAVPDRDEDPVPERPVPLVLSAASPSALRAARVRLSNRLMRSPELRLGDVAHVLATGRRTLKHRLALSARTPKEAAARLADWNRWPDVIDVRSDLPVVFGFPGLGDQYVRCGIHLYDEEPEFRAVLDQCFELMDSMHGVDLHRVMMPGPSEMDEAAALLRRPGWGQPAIFAIGYALARTLLHAGIRPEVMIGHSVGEYAAACVAGVFSLPDALKLAAARGRLMDDTPPGAMMAVNLPAPALAAMLPPDLDIAGINAPEQTVVSGTIEAVATFEEALEEADILHTVLGASLGAHSRLMDGITEPFREIVESVQLRPPTVPISSTLLGGLAGAARMVDPEYWVRHLREPVRFIEAAQAIAERGPVALVEVGPGRALCGMYRQSEGDLGSGTIAPLRPGEPEPTSRADLACQVWTVGGSVDWTAHLRDQEPRRVSLPGYPFQRSSFWVSGPRGDASRPPLEIPSPPLLQRPVWQPAPRKTEEGRTPAGRLVVLVASEGDAVAAALGGTGRDVDEVVVSGDFDASRVADALSSGDVAAIVLAPPGLEIDQTVTSDRVDAVLSQAVWPLLQTVPTLAASAGQRPAHLLIVTRGRHQVRGDEEVVPELSLLTGPARVIPQEYPDVRVTELDFAADASPEVVAEACAAELAEADASAPVAYRDGVRYALTFEPARQTLGMRPWAASRSYLITGGLGGIGLAVAEDAARTPGVRLTLTHRSPLPTSEERRRLLHDVTIPVERRRRLEAMDRLEQSGAVVRFERADVTDVEAMRRVREQFGPFTGIVHAAGVPGGRLLPAIDHDHFSRVIDPKVRGTLNLDAVVADSATEWMVLCSSLASVVGGLGHTDYCSGNAFMDAFAAWRDAKGKRTVSLGYDMWTDVGMAVRESDRWLGARALLGRSDQIRLSPIEHPHFESEGRSGDIVEYHGTVAEGVDWIVDEHRLYGVALVPGTAILELLRAGAARGLGVEKVGLAEVDLLAPFEVGGAGPSRFAVVLEPDDDGGHSVRLASLPPRGDQWIDHALARVLEEVETPDHDPIREPAKTATQGDAPSPLASSAVSLGPRWDNVIKTERPSPDELILDCELSVDFLADLQKFWVHPALLDTAAGALLPLLDERPHLPMSYEYVDARRPMPSRVRSRIVRRHDAPLRSLMFDVLVQDEQGRDVLEMRGYTLRRIEAVAPPVQPRDAHENGSSTANRALASGTAGDLTSLDYIPVPRRRPGPGEVEVEVLATGLNFKEVLIAAGLLGSNAEAYHFGLECAGVVASVGPGVTRFHVGDSVAGMGPGCFSDFACLNQDLVSAIPPGLTYAQAASIPVAFTTAYDCLTNLAALESGETILVHAVTGGVGSAAAQVAHHLGARVFGTAGTEAKRAVARQMGVERVMDSRSTRFEAETLEAGGVDVVLNSLAGEFIHAGLRTLRPRGRFIELGRRDVESGSLLDLNLFAPGRTFAVYYPAPDSKEFIASFQSVMALCRDGSIEALPLHLFPSSRVVEAFGFMSRAEQVGKVVVGRSGADQVVGRGGAAGGASITRPTGVRALRWALALRRPHVVASPRPVGTIGEDEMVVAEHALEPAREAELRARGELRYDFVPPEGEVETRLADIWMSVLSLERVGREDRFLDLGGDSLYATQVAAKIRATFDVRVAPSQILADQPLRDLAERLDGEDVAVRA